jgi:hypothetical protein
MQMISVNVFNIWHNLTVLTKAGTFLDFGRYSNSHLNIYSNIRIIQQIVLTPDRHGKDDMARWRCGVKFSLT